MDSGLGPFQLVKQNWRKHTIAWVLIVVTERNVFLSMTTINTHAMHTHMQTGTTKGMQMQPNVHMRVNIALGNVTFTTNKCEGDVLNF